MRLEHAGTDYRRELEVRQELHAPFGIDLPKFNLPFNPVTSCSVQPARIAFWGLNAYCRDEDYDVAQKYKNFAEQFQSEYNSKLFSVMRFWQEGLASNYMAGGSVYYSNFIKLVLRKTRFKKAVDAEHALRGCPKCLALFEEIALAELISLRDKGCKVFVCFGWAVFALMESIASEAKVRLVREYHFSRYSRRHTECLIQHAL